MKKSTLFIFLLVSVLVTQAQVKHNKFTTRIKFDQFNVNADYWTTRVSELKDNSGYFLTNLYTNPSGDFAPSLVRLDVDGNVIMDTVNMYMPISSPSSNSSVKNVITSATNHIALYQTDALSSQMLVASPYLVNYDLNGNILWHLGFIDNAPFGVDLETNKLIATQDGGYLIAGTLYDWNNGNYPASGFSIKVDNSGNMQWHKCYMNRDTMEVHFEDVIEVPSGGYFFAGAAPNFQGGSKPLSSFGYLLNFAKTDTSGNTVWSNALELGAPIDHFTECSGFSTVMVDDTNALVSYTGYDTTSTSNSPKIIVTSINVDNGVTNWTKYYTVTSPGVDLETIEMIKSNDGRVVVSANDYTNFPSKGVLFSLDLQGNYIETKRFTYGGFSGRPYSLINTIDGGFAVVGEVDMDEVLIVKTDKTLDPSCSDVDSTYAALTSTLISDTSHFGFLDSIYTIPTIVQSFLTPSVTHVATSDDSLICSCSNAITGTVVDGVTPVNGAKVFLFKKGIVPKPWAPIDSMVTGVAGTYMFNYVPTDSFLVKVEPSPIFNPNSMISYHKHLDTCYKWESAGVFYAHCDSGTVVKDVTLITPPPLTGNSSLNGYVFEYSGSFNKMQPGDPIPGIDITVEQSPGGIIGGSTSGGNGYYDLSNINSSATYIVSIDFPGLPHDSIYTIAINLNDTTLDSLNFYVDSTGIYILVEPLGTGITVANDANLKLEMYPNPTSGSATLMINAIKPKDIYIDVTNEVGKVISSTTERINSGVNKINLNTNNLSSGIYFIKVREKGKLYVRKLVKY